MKLVLASYFQPENHGSGVKYGVSPDKPKNVEGCDLVFSHLSPTSDDYYNYHRDKKTDPDEAGPKFLKAFRATLAEFKEGVLAAASSSNKTIFEILPFKDGDTLLSWEHKGHLSYRAMIATTLRELGYEVIEN